MLLLFFISVSSKAQNSTSQLVMEDAYARVTRYSADPFDTGTLKFDAIVVPISAGAISFVKRGDKFVYDGAGSKGVLLVELKKHWDAEIRPCSEPSVCVRPIKAGQQVIGETRSIFSNGFISAYAHRMERGGTLTSSYFTSKGSDHIVLIPLTALKVNFSGIDEELKAGTAYSSDSTEVEVTAEGQDVRWVVIRIHK